VTDSDTTIKVKGEHAWGGGILWRLPHSLFLEVHELHSLPGDRKV